MKKFAAILFCAILAVSMAACGSSEEKGKKKVTGSKGDEYVVDEEAKTVQTDETDTEYEPYTITLNLERSGIGQNMEETFTSAPKKVIADGDQMADFFFDLGLEDHMAGFTKVLHCSKSASARGFCTPITEPSSPRRNEFRSKSS